MSACFLVCAGSWQEAYDWAKSVRLGSAQWVWPARPVDVERLPQRFDAVVLPGFVNHSQRDPITDAVVIRLRRTRHVATGAAGEFAARVNRLVREARR